MPHQKIATKLTVISNENSLARFFHSAKDKALCYACHHNSQLAAAKKFPDCGTCHSRPFDPREPGKPGILAAYHQQCIGCHEAMNQKPKALDCDKCHPKKEAHPALKVEIPLQGIWK
jgi:Zn finger protein HypA/HybF involved in hydrogenase expression